jgi:hypothetical protein
VATNTAVTATFNKAVVAATISFVLKDSNSNTVAATVSYNDTNHTATLTPNAPLANAATYTATVSGAQDASGNGMAAPAIWSFITATASSGPFTIWSGSAGPTNVDSGDANAVELGVKFRSDVPGQISGILFYKSAANIGVHVGNLWSSTGTLLASATFTNETASGWQLVNFSTPVSIQANTTYVASYHTAVGHFADDQNYFATSGVDNVPLHALKNGVDGGNGVFLYGLVSGFPNQSYLSSNYWVDVVLNTNQGGGALPPSLSGDNSPRAGLGDGSGPVVYYYTSLSPCCLGGFQVTGLYGVPVNQQNFRVTVNTPPRPGQQDGSRNLPSVRALPLPATYLATFNHSFHQVSLGSDVLPAGYGSPAILGWTGQPFAGHAVANHTWSDAANSTSFSGMAGSMVEGGPMLQPKPG